MLQTRLVRALIPLLLLTFVVAACGGQAQEGTLQFTANGEDFVRQGFVSKDGWHITFDHVYVHLADVTAYQTDPPYDPHAGGEIQGQAEAQLEGTHLVDLSEGGEDAPPILVGQVEDAPAGHYNAIAWRMTPAPEGPAAGYSLLIVGTAGKAGQTIPFRIGVGKTYHYACGEYVGDVRKGILEADGTAQVEMTFHFDHIFGDAETPPDDELNVGAPGFEPFAGLVKGGRVETDLAALQGQLPPEVYGKLVDILPTLGHVGEGHCHCETE